VEYAKLPPVEMLAKLKELAAKDASAPRILEDSGKGLASMGDAAIRTRALFDCAAAAIGVERFRLQQGRWPDSLDEVVAAKLLDSVPIDHFDGNPLRYRKASDGVVVYSIGQNGDYRGYALDRSKTTDPDRMRVEFRLWDEAYRRQPPPPRPKAEEKSDDQ
jgi:hypothetical protein